MPIKTFESILKERGESLFAMLPDDIKDVLIKNKAIFAGSAMIPRHDINDIDVFFYRYKDYKNAVDNINILKQLDNSVKAELSNIVKRAYQMCEMYAEKRLLDAKCNKSPVGYIFALKNFQGDFVDKTEVEQTNNNIEVKLED